MIDLKKGPATLDEQKIFQLPDGEEIWTFERIRIVNYKIEQLEISKLPVAMFPDLSKEVVEHSIQNYVEQKGFRISHYITSYDHYVKGTIKAAPVQARDPRDANHESSDLRRWSGL